jgi:hypothetical protein
MDAREERLGLNEALFREVNERMREVSDAFAIVDLDLELVCECADERCGERLRVTTAEYERIRADPALFIVSPGHVATDVEYVAESGDGYEIVRKDPGDPERLAEATDPRAAT